MASLASAYGLANQSNTEIYLTQPFFKISLLFEINVEWLTLNQQHSHNPTMFIFTYTYLLTPLGCPNLCSFLVTLVPLSLRILTHHIVKTMEYQSMLEKRWLIFNFLHPSYQFSLLLPEFVQTGQVQFFMNVTVLLQFMTHTFPCFQFSIVLLILSP